MQRARGDPISGTTESPEAAVAPRVGITAELMNQMCPGRTLRQAVCAPQPGLRPESDPGASQPSLILPFLQNWFFSLPAVSRSYPLSSSRILF